MTEKTAAEIRQEERDKIAVTSVKKDDDGNVIVEAKKEEKEVTLEKQAEEVKEEIIDENKEEIEKSEKTEEELEAEKQEAKTAAQKTRIQKRIDKEVAKRKTLENENAELKKLLAAKDTEDDKFTSEDVKKEAERIANEKVNEREFTNACNRLAEAAKKLDKEFDKKMATLAEDVAPIPGYMIGILDDLDNGGAVLKHFTENPDIYEDVIALTPAKMAVAVTKLSNKIETESKPKPKAISKVPPPIEPLGGKGGGNSTIITEADTKDMPTFVKKRAAQVEARRKEKMAGMSR